MLNSRIWMLVLGLVAISPTFAARATTTSHGVRLDESCPNLENAISDAKARIQNCQTRYPQLSLYLEDWQLQLPRLPIHCEITPGLRGQHRPGSIVLASHVASALFHGPTGSGRSYESAIKTLVHEVFHSTGANNSRTRAHNQHMGANIDLYDLAPGQNNLTKPMYARFSPFCLEDYTTDRVEVLAELCTGADRGVDLGEFAAIQHLLRSRNQECGQNSCVDLFMGELYRTAPLDRLMGKVKNLNRSAAEAVCSRIQRVGYCYDQRIRQNSANPPQTLRECEAAD